MPATTSGARCQLISVAGTRRDTLERPGTLSLPLESRAS
jgi:hypothetical protein